MGDLPSGTVTFLFTDIEGSTRLWDERGGEMEAALADHDAIVRGAVESNNGYVFATGGDGFAAAFGSASDAVAAAQQSQAALDGDGFIRARMGIHTGEVQERDGDYFGPAVNQAARIMDAGHGGQVLLSEVSATLIKADCVDLGEHALSGISGLVGIRQLGAAEFPALRGGTAGGAMNLPVYRTSLIGRDELLASVRSALTAGSLVTLTGVGGVGKTRLAVEVADRVDDVFPDGVWFVGLAQLGDGAALPRTVLSELGLEVSPGDPLDVLATAMAHNRVLLVLDNCEHVIVDAAELVEELMDRCPALAVLATSREGLAVPGEHLVAVSPLSGKVSEGEASSERMRMLMDRALAANPAVGTTEADHEALGTIADELDGVPLAIELAAARLSALTPVQVAERLGDRFRLLTGGRRSRERHQTLRATVQWSYDLLDEQSQRLFDELSVFSDGFTLELALLIASELEEVEVIETLEDLVQKSMIVFNPTDGPGRYRMLMTLRQFGQENVDAAGIAEQVRETEANALADYIAGLVDGLSGESELDNRRAIHAEMSNISSVCEWALAKGVAEPAGRLVSSCQNEVNQTCSMRIAEQAAQLADLLPDSSSSLPGVLGCAAWLNVNKLGFSGTEAWLERAKRAMEVAPSHDWRPVHVGMMSSLAIMGRQAEAIEIGFREVENAVQRGEVDTEAFYLSMLPFYLSTLNRAEEAIAVGRSAVDLNEQAGHSAAGAVAATGLGYALAWSGSSEAIPILQKASGELRAHGWVFLEAAAERSLAQAVTTTGEHSEAARLLLHVMEETATTRPTMIQSSCLVYAARLLVQASRWQEAAIAAGCDQHQLVYLSTPAYADLHRELNDAINTNIGMDAADELRIEGAAMSNEETITWARTTLQLLAQS